ncbi:acyltransferase family protein [Sphingobium yanoikuyae]|uniref:Acyltransferase n=1 Tax=Sphingobium yanoikuyae TaxID=13690 RepID=A0A9X7YFB4_SPHYA|nr:acyltransferase family protein [Sphingobium yanoikuyae]QNG48490.1 acyltransferase [Sphingobium yanoikuyae]
MAQQAGAVYRRDIDGLRAFAVLPVVAYHLKLPFITGGYIGVDIFFVISGFLITGILAREIDRSEFSIARFYERRIRRIFPAMFCMLGISTVAGCLILFPHELSSYGQSLIWNALFLSNNYFLLSSNYFSPAGDTKPLIHTWSLAVEEQFYIFFPPLLYSLRQRMSGLMTAWVLVAVAAASLLISVVLLSAYPSAVFYLAPLRAWELLMGSILALRIVPPLPRAMREMLGALGLLLIVMPVFLYTHATPFPGIAALVPCLGAALLIYSGCEAVNTPEITRTARLLSMAPFVWVGLISYSLYLWHWPVIVFYRMAVTSDPGPVVKLLLLAMMIVMAAGSWWGVERPFRKRQLLGSRRAVFISGGAVIALSSAVGSMLILTGGLGSRFSPRVSELSSYLDLDTSVEYRQGRCFLSNEEGSSTKIDAAACLAKEAGRRNYLLLGDSHGAHLWWGLAKTYPDIHFMQATASGCRPLLKAPGQAACMQQREDVLEKRLPLLKPDAVLLAARWRADELPELARTVRYLRRFTSRVVVFGPIVQYGDPLPRLLADEERGGRDDLVSASRKPLDRKLDDKMAMLVQLAGGEYVSLYKALCSGKKCQSMTREGVPLQFDYGHLTPEGSIALAQHWRMLDAFR